MVQDPNLNDDISAELAGAISAADVQGSSENIRCGKYEFIIKRVHAKKVKTEKGEQKFVFAEVTPRKSEPNPQFEGNVQNGKLIDDGNTPNVVGSDCAMKVNFSGNGAMSAPGNVAAFALGVLGKTKGEISEEALQEAWLDMARQKAVQVGDPIGIKDGKVITATKAKAANPLAGVVVRCTAFQKKKAKIEGMTPDKHYVTKLTWSCISPPGEGENSPELVAQRRAEIASHTAVAAGDTDEGEDDAPAAPPPAASANGANGHTEVPPPPPAVLAPPTPPTPPAPFPPKGSGWFTNGMQPGFAHNGKDIVSFDELRKRLGASA